MTIWRVNEGSKIDIESVHSGQVLDAVWMPMSETKFASCSTSGEVFIHELNEEGKVESFSLLGHTGEVNSVKYSANGDKIATCSDDWSIRVWKGKECEFCLNGHTKEVCVVEWSNTGEGSYNPDKKRILASASFDATVRIWVRERERERRKLISLGRFRWRVLARVDKAR